MSAHQAVFPVVVMARVLGVSESGFHAWRNRHPSAHTVADAALLKRIRTVHASSRETYGAPRIHAELRARGEKHGRKRIARLMRAAGLAGASRRGGSVVTTRRDRDARPAPDLVDRNFVAVQPKQLWVADITFVPTASGFLYLAVVLDAWSRKIVGWSMANHLRAELVLEALEMAIGQRRPNSVIHHSDQGSQYTSLAFGNRCREAGVRPSMGTVGEASLTMPCARVSSRRSNASCSTGAGSPPKLKRGWPSSASSKAGTTRSGCAAFLGYRSPMAYETMMEMQATEP